MFKSYTTKENEINSVEEFNEEIPNEEINIYNNRKTDIIMTKYEYARVVASLAEMYAEGLSVHEDLKDKIKNIIDPIDLAELHLKLHIPCPIDIVRPFLNNTNEIFHPHEMILPDELINIGKVEDNQTYKSPF